MFHAGDGARRNARSTLQILGSDARQGNTAHFVACRFPCLARHAEHGALSRPGIADHNAEIAPVRDIRQRVGLLAGQDKAALFGAGQSGFSVPVADLVPLPLGHYLSGAVQPLFRLDHVAGGEPILTASVLPKLDQIG